MAARIVDGTQLNTAAHEAAVPSWLIPAAETGLERLQVYAGGYPVRVQEALAETYPAVAHLVGDGAFAALARRFAAAVPLHSYNLNDAGLELPAFLRSDRLTADLPFLPDLALLEWHVARAFHAYEQAPLDPATLSGWGVDEWQHAAVRFQPAVAVVTSNWPIRELWECRETPLEAIDIDLRGRADRVLIQRAGFAVVCASVDEDEAGVLGALLAGETLGVALASVGDREDGSADVSAWFARWMAGDMITGCELPAERYEH
jgi:putative DNA-binding protein